MMKLYREAIKQVLLKTREACWITPITGVVIDKVEYYWRIFARYEGRRGRLGQVSSK